MINTADTVRMTGCPNGCGRSVNSEIGFVGTAMGKYNMHLGGDRLGFRLNKIGERVRCGAVLYSQTLRQLFFLMQISP